MSTGGHGEFSAREWLRYSRQVPVAGFGVEGQRRLRRAHVVIVGMGGLGCPAAQYLVGAGVGRLTLIDGDRVELSNLHRQVLYAERDCGALKVEAAATRLRELNTAVEITARAEWLGASHEDIIADCDLVLDCSDQYRARRLLNRLCLRRQRPWCYASVEGFATQTAWFEPGRACYECVFPHEPAAAATCAGTGVLGPVPAMAGTQQALAAIAYLCGLDNGVGYLYAESWLPRRQRAIGLVRDPDCICHRGCEVPLPEPGVMPSAGRVPAWEVSDGIDRLRRAGWRTVDIRTREEYEAFNLGDPRQTQEVLLSQLGRGQLPQPLALYCQSGVRSGPLAQLLRERGAEVVSVAGGLRSYLARQVPGHN